jgi:hypothetical protein
MTTDLIQQYRSATTHTTATTLATTASTFAATTIGNHTNNLIDDYHQSKPPRQTLKQLG